MGVEFLVVCVGEVKGSGEGSGLASGAVGKPDEPGVHVRFGKGVRRMIFNLYFSFVYGCGVCYVFCFCALVSSFCWCDSS